MIRFDARWIGLAVMVLSAAIVLAVLWLGLSLLLSLRDYIPAGLR